MKIECLSDLDNFRLSRTGKTYIKISTKEYYTFEEQCVVCNTPYMKGRKNTTNCCSMKCAQLGDRNHQYGKTKELNPWYNKNHTKETKEKLSKYNKGKNNASWKGGVINKNLPLFETYAEQLAFVEEVRQTESEGLLLLEVRCKKCNKWFVPNRIAVRHRLAALNNTSNSQECNFYCSYKCKKECSIFGLHNGGIELSSKKYNTELKIWSKEVIKRANGICEICGKEAIDAHHIIPKKINSFFMFDTDNGIALCKKCHRTYGHSDYCSYIKLANRICK